LVFKAFNKISTYKDYSSLSCKKRVKKRMQVDLYTTIHVVEFRHFLNLNLQIPACQRQFTIERIDELFDNISNVFSKNKEVPFLGTLKIAKFENKLYIVDGQHRYFAYKRFFEKYNLPFRLGYEERSCDSYRDVQDYFRSINDITYLENIDLQQQDRQEFLKQYILKFFPLHCLSKSKQPRFPNISIDQVTYHFSQKYAHIPLYKLEMMFEEINQSVGETLKIEDPMKYKKATEKNGLFIGYLFQSTLGNGRDKNPKSISKALREAVWKRYYIDLLNKGLCICNSEIDFFNHHCGHIISKKNGGQTIINNLIPICVTCNLSMGMHNLDEFSRVCGFREITTIILPVEEESDVQGLYKG